MLEYGFEQKDLWGINLYPKHFGNESWIEFDSMINLCFLHRSRGVNDLNIRKRIIEIVNTLIKA